MLSRVLEVSTFLPMKQAKSQPSTDVWCVLLYLLAVLWGWVPVPIRLYAAKVSPFRMHVQMNISIYFCHQSVTKRGWPFICFFFYSFLVCNAIRSREKGHLCCTACMLGRFVTGAALRALLLCAMKWRYDGRMMKTNMCFICDNAGHKLIDDWVCAALDGNSWPILRSF